MKIKRTWFTTLSIVLYECLIFAALAFSFAHLGEGKDYSALYQAEWLIAVLLVLCLLILFSSVFARLDIPRRLREKKIPVTVIESILGVLLLGFGFLVRASCILNVEIEPAGEFKTYYEIGRLMSLSHLPVISQYYCDYIALFPSVFAYSRLLSGLFSVFPDNVTAAQYLNLFLQVLTLFLVWRIGRLIAGKIAGLAALAAAACWPSMIIYSPFLAGEFEYTLMIMLGLYLLLRQMKTPLSQDHPFLHAFLLLVAGYAFAVAADMNTAALAYLVFIVIFLTDGIRKMPVADKNDIPLGHRMVSNGLKCFLILLAGFIPVYCLLNFRTGYDVDRAAVSPAASLGYSAMVGLNLESEGTWNQADSDFLFEKYAETASAAESHLRCLDLARERLKQPKDALLNLLFRKLGSLMGKDEYATSLSILHLEETGKLTDKDRAFYYRMADICNLYFISALLLAGIGGLMSFFRGRPLSSILIMILNWTVPVYMVLECQNKNHYMLLPVMAVMSGIAVREIAKMCEEYVMKVKLEKQAEIQAEAAEKKKLSEMRQQKEEIKQMRTEALHAQFDMDKAIREGHIRIICSQAVGENGGKPAGPAAASAAAAEHAPSGASGGAPETDAGTAAEHTPESTPEAAPETDAGTSAERTPYSTPEAEPEADAGTAAEQAPDSTSEAGPETDGGNDPSALNEPG